MKASNWFWLAVLALVLSVPLVRADAAENKQDVRVINTAAEAVPVAAQGTTTVAGTVAATQSGPWTVGINGAVSATQSGPWTVGVSGNIAATSADLTQQVLATRYVQGPVGGGTGEFDSDIIDVSSYKSVRVMVQILGGAGCCTESIEVIVSAVTSIGGGGTGFDPTTRMVIAHGGQYLNEVFETPPQQIQVAGVCRPGTCAMDILVVGRRN